MSDESFDWREEIIPETICRDCDLPRDLRGGRCASCWADFRQRLSQWPDAGPQPEERRKMVKAGRAVSAGPDYNSPGGITDYSAIAGRGADPDAWEAALASFQASQAASAAEGDYLTAAVPQSARLPDLHGPCAKCGDSPRVRQTRLCMTCYREVLSSGLKPVKLRSTPTEPPPPLPDPLELTPTDYFQDPGPMSGVPLMRAEHVARLAHRVGRPVRRADLRASLGADLSAAAAKTAITMATRQGWIKRQGNARSQVVIAGESHPDEPIATNTDTQEK